METKSVIHNLVRNINGGSWASCSERRKDSHNSGEGPSPNYSPANSRDICISRRLPFPYRFSSCPLLLFFCYLLSSFFHSFYRPLSYVQRKYRTRTSSYCFLPLSATTPFRQKNIKKNAASLLLPFYSWSNFRSECYFFQLFFLLFRNFFFYRKKFALLLNFAFICSLVDIY